MRTVVLMRHGFAEDHAARDADRQLTTAGRAEVGRMAQFAARHLRVDVVLHSPFVRARETALIMAKALAVSCEESADFVPDASAAQAANHISSDPRSLVVVTHLPLHPALLGSLLGAGVSFDVTPGTLAWLTLGRGFATLRALVAPQHLGPA